MTRESTPPQLSNEQKRKVGMYLSAGCDREAAAKLTDCSHWEIHCAMLRDSAFADEIRRAEGASELAHIRNVQNAALDVKNWRASVWWLERRSPERFGRRGADTVTTRQLKAFVGELVTIIVEELPNAKDQQRLLDRFDQLVKSLDQLIFEDSGNPSDTAGSGPTHLLENSVDDPTDLDDDFA